MKVTYSLSKKKYFLWIHEILPKFMFAVQAADVIVECGMLGAKFNKVYLCFNALKSKIINHALYISLPTFNGYREAS